MRYTKEFKLECVHKYLNHEYIKDPGGCTHKTFIWMVRHWVATYQNLGDAGLSHNKPKLTVEDKLEICNRIDNGETFNQVAISYGRKHDYVSKIYKIYLRDGVDGLKSSSKRGRPSKMKKEKINLEKLSPEEREKELLARIERLEIENEYLKKLDALVQKRMAQQQKKK